MIRYDYKIRDIDWTFLFQIPEKEVMNTLRFEWIINWWIWSLQLEVNYKLNKDLFLWKIIEIRAYNEFNPNWRVVYKWRLSRINKRFDERWEYQVLQWSWLFPFINRVLYKIGWSYLDQPTIDPWQLIKDVVAYYSSINPSIISENVSLYWTELSFNLREARCWDVLKRIIETTNDYYFYIKSDWEILYNPYDWATTVHKLKKNIHIESIDIWETVEWLINKSYSYVVNTWISTFEDTQSIADFWLSEIAVGADDNVTANAKAQTKMEANKDLKRETTIVINNKYDFLSIIPWHKVSIDNTSFIKSNFFVKKVVYTPYKCTLYVDTYESLQSIYIK